MSGPSSTKSNRQAAKVENPAARMEEKFTRIWRQHLWNPPGGQAPRSGCGSTLHYTENLRRELPKLIDAFGITSCCDAPCGDLTWMQCVRLPEGVVYVGADIVEPLIRQLRADHPHAQLPASRHCNRAHSRGGPAAVPGLPDSSELLRHCPRVCQLAAQFDPARADDELCQRAERGHRHRRLSPDRSARSAFSVRPAASRDRGLGGRLSAAFVDAVGTCRNCAANAPLHLRTAA